MTTSVDKSKPLIDVSLFLRGDSLDPALVTAMLGTAGSRMRKKGEVRKTSTNREVTAKTGLWELESERGSDADRGAGSVHDQISWLRQALSAAQCPPADITGVQEVEILIIIALGENGRGGGEHEFLLTPEELRWIANLGAVIYFDVSYTPE